MTVSYTHLTSAWIPRYLKANDKRPVVVVGLVENKSHEHINSETFIKDVEKAIIRDGNIRLVVAGEKRNELRKERAEQQDYASPETTKMCIRDSRMDLYKNRISFFVLCLGITFFSSCTDGDNNDDWKLDLPELSVDSVSMLGVIGMHGAVMFSINDVPYIGLGDIPLVGKNRCFFYYSDEKRSWESIGEYPGGAREGAVAFVIGNKAYVGLGITITIRCV